MESLYASIDPARRAEIVAKARAESAAKFARGKQAHFEKWDKIYDEHSAANEAADARASSRDASDGEYVSAASKSSDPLSAWKPRKEPKPKKEGPFLEDSSSSEWRQTLKRQSGSEECGGFLVSQDSVSVSRDHNAKHNGAAATTKQPNTNSNSATLKRPAPPTGLAERDRGASLSGTKIQKRGSIATSSTTAATAMSESQPGAERQPPKWYNTMSTAMTNRRNPNLANAGLSLDRLKFQMSKMKAEHPRPPSTATLSTTREMLHTLIFQEVDKALLRSKRLLHNSDGLPQIFDDAYSGGVVYPYDIKADAEELYNKWCTGQFETDLLRGIDRGKPGKGKDKDKSEGNRVDKLAANAHEYRLMDVKTHGNGKLLNGAWWPTQLAAMRDGAHGHTIAGIVGEKGQGVYSLVMAGGIDPSGQPYPNIDNGNVVQYCGTDSTDGEPSNGTQFLLESVSHPNPVRLIRSSKLNNQYAPELGFRYDGLYDVVASERMDDESSVRQRYRFKLVRVGDQDPIRGSGPEKRPTTQEIEAYKKDKSLRGY